MDSYMGSTMAQLEEVERLQGLVNQFEYPIRQAEKFKQEGEKFRQTIEKELNQKALWSSACTLLTDFGIRVVILAGSGTEDLMEGFLAGDSTDRGCRAVRVGDKKFVAVFQDELENHPTSLFGLLHEAAHLITDQFDDFRESEGVCQVELALARSISEKLYEDLKVIHRDEYGWDASSYAVEKKTGRWRRGVDRAKFLCSKLPKEARDVIR